MPGRGLRGRSDARLRCVLPWCFPPWCFPPWCLRARCLLAAPLWWAVACEAPDSTLAPAPGSPSGVAASPELEPWLDRFTTRPEAFWPALRQADPPTRAWVVRGLSERLSPPELAALSEGLSREGQTSLVTVVELARARPHLRADTPRRGPQADAPHPAPWRLGFGPGQRYLRRLHPTERRAPPAGADEPPDEARAKAAVAAAAEGDLVAVAGWCQGIAEARYQADCFFRAAEARAAPTSPHLSQAVRMCADAELDGTSMSCLNHVAAAAGEQLPAFSRTDATTWRGLGDLIDGLEPAMVEDGLGPMQGLAPLLWSCFVEASANRDAALAVDLAVLPPAARPPARSRLAWALLVTASEHPGPEPVELAHAVRRLEELEADPTQQGTLSPTPAGRACRPPEHTRMERWTEELPDERGLDRTVLSGWGAVLRAVAADPRADRAIALLEAAARQPALSEAPALLRQGLDDPDPTVRWTAQRLLQTDEGAGSAD